MLPFSPDEFFALFARYNLTIWPAQIVAYGLGGLAVWAIATGQAWSWKVAAFILAGFWLWSGLVYHLAFFTTINPAGFGCSCRTLWMPQAPAGCRYAIAGGDVLSTDRRRSHHAKLRPRLARFGAHHATVTHRRERQIRDCRKPTRSFAQGEGSDHKLESESRYLPRSDGKTVAAIGKRFDYDPDSADPSFAKSSSGIPYFSAICSRGRPGT